MTTPSTTTVIDPAADRALKARHRAVWALGDYPAVAIDVIPELGPLRTMKPYAPPPPPGAQPSPLWGDEDHVRGFFGDRVTDVVARRQTLTTDRFPTPEAWRQYWKAVYGPAIAGLGVPGPHRPQAGLTAPPA